MLWKLNSFPALTSFYYILIPLQCWMTWEVKNLSGENKKKKALCSYIAFSECTSVNKNLKLLWKKKYHGIVNFSIWIELCSWNFSMLPKIQFYLYIFKCNYWLKKEPKHTHTKITKQEKPTNQPTLKCQLIQKSA